MAGRMLEAKVGALVIVAVTLLIGFVVLLGNVSVGARRILHVEFADSGSMLAGAPVKIAGVRAGRVEAVEFLVARDARRSAPRFKGEPPINVRVTLAIDEAMAPSVRQDSQFIITTQGVLGEKYLEIVPGTGGSPEWAADSDIRGSDPPRVDVLFSRIDSIMAQVQEALSGEDGQVRVGELVTRLTRLVKNVDELLERNGDKLDVVFDNVAAASGDARQLIVSLNRGLGDGTDLIAVRGDLKHITGVAAKEIGPTVQVARRTLQRADAALATVTELVEGNREPIAATLQGLPPVLARAEAITRDVQYVTDGLKSGRGTVGQLIVDQEIYDDLKEMLRDLKRHPWKVLWRE
ncbi:MAG: MCE family protein [Myxococcales bacterium]|nr:MCE family protein [Myxococcales bacterium]MCB9522035.1 MCE family protein [Myxococcales bacterium]